MPTILDRLRMLFRAHPPTDEGPAEPAPDLLIHFSLTGFGTPCGFGDGVFRWTIEMEHVTCQACKERTDNMLLHNQVTVR